MKATGPSPDSSAGTDCPAPLNGMWVKFTPACDLNASMVMWWIEPLPEDAYASGCGEALAKAINSVTLVAGTEGCTTSHIVVATESVTGASSRNGSNGMSR